MRQLCSFCVTPLDCEQLNLQVAYALEKRTELISRKKYPKIWGMTDKLNSVEAVPQAIRENRQKRRGFLGLLNWLAGVMLLIPGLLEPQKLFVLLLVGTASLVCGTVALWKNGRTAYWSFPKLCWGCW